MASSQNWRSLINFETHTGVRLRNAFLNFGLLPPFLKKQVLQKIQKKEKQKIYVGDFAGLTDQSTCLDCGANIGNVTETLLETGSYVFAFEPDPVAFEKLEKRFSGNDRVALKQEAVGVDSGSVKLFRHKDFETDDHHTISSTLFAEKKNTGTNFVEVEKTNLLNFIENFDGEIDLLKMDIEGAEVDILEGIISKQLHTTKLKAVLCETHERVSFSHAWRTAKIRATITLSRNDNINLDHTWIPKKID